ncbi:MAG: 7-cyano-7-deazaguanine synthase QueC [Acidobacteriota bacterium]
MKEKALILFSGGLDSTTVLYWAKNRFEEVLPVIIDYSQKHSIEVKNAIKIADKNDLRYIHIRFPLNEVLGSALLDTEREIPDSLATAKDERGVPQTYVPFRNGIFLALAAGIAETRGIRNILTGFNLIDTPDYPDTTKLFSDKMEEVINIGTASSITGEKYRIITPLIDKSKKEIIELGLELGADYSLSVSCYRGSEMPCLKCPSCDIRQGAFNEIGIEDPLISRLKMEKQNET